MTLKVGQIIEEYQIVSEIGRGGNGIVFKGQSLDDDRDVAIKVPFPERVKKDPTLVSSFLRETSAIARLEHPNIASYYKVGTNRFEDGEESFVLPYLIMEFVKGEPCSCLEKKSIRKIVTLMQKVAEAVAYAHGKGVIHRDLKPTNIFVDSENNPKILDFGLAQLMDQVTTASGIFEGSPSFAAPEQFKGEKCDERSDIWMLGSILFSLLTGRPPFVPPTHAEMNQMQQVFAIQEQILKSPTPKPTKWNSEIDEYLEKICLKALNKDAKLRYQTADDFAADLKNWNKVNRDYWMEKSKKNIRGIMFVPKCIKKKMIKKSYDYLIKALSYGNATTPIKEHLSHLLHLQGMEDIVLLEMALPSNLTIETWEKYLSIIQVCSCEFFDFVLPIQKVVIGQDESEGVPHQVLTIYRQPKGESLQLQIGKISFEKALDLIHKIETVYRFFRTQGLEPALPEPPEIFLEPLNILAGGWPFRFLTEAEAPKELGKFLYYILTGFQLTNESPDLHKLPAKIRDTMMRTFAEKSEIKTLQEFVNAIDRNLEAYKIIESGILDRTFEFPEGEYWFPNVLKIEKTGHMKLKGNTILHFESCAGIISYGQITAKGVWDDQKEEGSIRFTAVNPKEGWGGIHVFNNNVHMEGCTLEHSHGYIETHYNISGGALHIDGGTVYILNSSFKANESSSEGAALSLTGSQNIELQATNVLFIENKTKRCGGAIAIDALSNAVFTTCHFEDNRSKEEGGVFYIKGNAIDQQTQVFLNDCLFIGNRTQISGGAIMVTQNATVVLEECNFDSNIADDSGGAILLIGKQEAIATVSIHNTKFSNNRAQIRGGAIAQKRYAHLEIQTCRFDGNSSDRDSGGAIAMDGKGGKVLTTSILQDSVFVENRCRVDGGAINANLNTDVLFEDCRFDSNAAEDNSGGAIVIVGENADNFSLARFIQCTFYRNRCKMDGGAINANVYSRTYFEECRFKNNTSEDSAGAFEIVGEEGEHCSEAIFQNVVFMSNKCKGAGGAICALDATNIGFDHCQFENNRAEEDGGAIYVRGTEAKASEILFKNCNFLENKSKQVAGAISLNIFCRSKIEACKFQSNRSENKDGGALYIVGKKGEKSTEATLFNVSFIENFANMDGGAVCIGDYSLIIMDKCRFDKNKAENSGGALSILGRETKFPTKITIRNSRFSENQAKYDGGAMIASYHTRMFIFDCLLIHNHADNNCGAIGIEGKADQGATKAKFQRVIFQENSCKNDGGAIAAATHCQIVLEECRFESNFTEGACGAIGLFGQDKKNLSEGTFRKVIFVNNRAHIDGGAMVIGRFSRTKFDQCIFEENYVEQKTGGAMLILGKDATFTTIADFQGVIFRKNYSTIDGGAINANIFSQVTFFNCLFEENIARQKNGGAIVLLGKNGSNPTKAQFKQVTFRKNQCNISGGAINANDFTRSYFLNCVFEENISHTKNGGAVLILGDDGSTPSDARFIGVEFKGNHAQGSGGAVNANVYTITVFEDCLFEKNSCEERGGGIFIRGFRRLPNKAQIKNCHFIGNMAGKMGADVAMNAVKGVTKESLIRDNKIEIKISDPDFLAEEAEETQSLLMKRSTQHMLNDDTPMESHKLEISQIRESYKLGTQQN
ncbi:MAG TPA: protein kinase [Planctomycetota bacterium]|nr:protein kinase [Planctomycetota bacterium]